MGFECLSKNAKNWFHLELLGVTNPEEIQINKTTAPKPTEHYFDTMKKKMIASMCTLTKHEPSIHKLMISTKHPISLKPKEAVKSYWLKDEIP